MTAAPEQRYVSREEAMRTAPRQRPSQRPSPSTELVRRFKGELVAWGQRVEPLPAQVWERHKHEWCAVWFGGDALRKDWLWYVRNRTRHAELDEQVRLSRTQGMLPARLGKDRADADAVATHRLRKSLLLALGAALAVLVSSVSAYRWDTGPELLGVGIGGASATLLLLGGGKYYRRDWVMRLAPLPVPILAAAGIESLRWWPAAIAAGLALLACERRGLRLASERPRASSSAKGLKRHDWIALWETVERVLIARGKPVTRTDSARPIPVGGSEGGVGFGLRSSEALLPEDVRALERDLGFPDGASSWVADPAAAGSGELRLLWEDPLPPRLAPRREPMSLTYTSRIDLAAREGGRQTALNLARVKVFLAGNSGAGKSEAMQEILDAVCDMRDARWVGIDVTESATLRQFAKQWNCDGVATTHEDARVLLRAIREECKDRNRQLDRGMDADLDGRMDQWWVVSEKPGSEGKFLFVDELAALTSDKECAEELVHLYDECRKASWTVVVATPDMDTKRVPPPCRDQSNIKVGFSMPFPDAVLLFGKGATQAGWEPYKLVPADEDTPNDAGKSFILGNGYNRAELHRWPHMPSEEVVARNVARREYRARVFGETARPSVASDEPDIVDAEIVSEEDVAREAAIRKAIGLCGDRPGLTPSEASDGLTADERGHVRRAAPSRSTYFPDSGASDRAHRVSDLVSALSDSTGRSTT